MHYALPPPFTTFVAVRWCVPFWGWGLVLGLFFFSQLGWAQGWQIYPDPARPAAYSLPADSLLGYNRATLAVREGARWRLVVARTGQVRISGLEELQPHEQGRYWLARQGNLWALADSGRIPLEQDFRYQAITYLGHGWAAGQRMGQAWVLRAGQLPAAPGYDIQHAHPHACVVRGTDGRVGILGPQGQFLIPALYDSARAVGGGGWLLASGTVAYLADSALKTLAQGPLGSFSAVGPGLVRQAAGVGPGVGLPRLWLVAARQALPLGQGRQPISCGPGLACIREGAIYVVYNMAGKALARLQSPPVPIPQEPGAFAARQAGQWRLFRPGRATVWLKVPAVVALSTAGLHGLRPWSPDGLHYGFVDEAGYVRISPRYLRVLPFAQAGAAVLLSQGTRAGWAVIDPNERLLCQPDFDTASVFGPSTGMMGKAGGLLITAESATPKLQPYPRLTAAPCGWRAEGFGQIALLDGLGRPLCQGLYQSLICGGPGVFVARTASGTGLLGRGGQVLQPLSFGHIRYDAVTGCYFAR